MGVEDRSDAREFLISRRAHISPEQAGLPSQGRRQVPGLRRAEVAMLAGVSVEYYSRLERGNLAGASAEVLEAIAGALRLDDLEREHLFDLARAASPATRRRRGSSTVTRVRPGLQLALDAVTAGPALVRNGRFDIIATNALGRALHSPTFAQNRRPANIARYCFGDRASADAFFPDWHESADTIVGVLRTEAGRDPHDAALQDLIGELSMVSADFRTKWAAHNVRAHAFGVKHFVHPVVGRLDLNFESAALVTEPSWRLQIYTADPGSDSADALRRLAAWAAEAASAVDHD